MILKKRTFLILLTGVCGLMYRCAQVLPLTGGSKDAQAPKIVSVLPADRTVDMPVKGAKIIFKFDEMVAAPSVSQKLIINPMMDEMPDITARGKTVTVEFNKELKPNTTYLLQFGNSVVDIHEANAASGLTYMFSTGPALDTSFITGNVVYTLSQKPAADMSILLYKNLSDTAPVRTKPDYMTRTDEKGNYFLSAVKPGIYQAIALSDKNKNLTYDPGEAVAFLNAPVAVNNDTINFMASVAKQGTAYIKSKIQSFYGLNKYVLSDTLPEAYIITPKSVDPANISFETRNDTLEVYYKNMYDTDLEFLVKNNISVIDTVNLQLTSKARTDSSYDKVARKITLRCDKAIYGATNDDVAFIYSLPVKNISAEKSYLIRDTVKEKPVLSAEKRNEENTLVTSYLPQYKRRLVNKLKAQTTYTMMCLPGSIETFWGTFNKDTVKTTFKTFSSEETGNLVIKLSLNDSIKAYVLQLLNANGTVVKEYSGVNKKENAVKFYNLPAAEYSLRLINDADENKKFTPSNFFKHVQAEAVWYYKKPLKTLAGWDIDAEWNMRDAKNN